MIVKFISNVGGQPIVLPCTQILICQDNGTPIVVAVEYGPEGAQAVGSVGHNPSEFHRLLKALGIERTVIVDTIKMPEPQPGARLVAGPT